MRIVKGKKFCMAVACVLFCMAVLSLCTTKTSARAQTGDFAGGSGTAADPYLVATAEQFDRVRYYRNAHFRQTAQLDFSSVRNFAPIGSVTFPFTGKYDGGKYTIRNLRVFSEENNAGLFAYVQGGEVCNVRIVNSEVRGQYGVGGVAGANNGTVIGCTFDGAVSGQAAVGGIVGLNASNGVVRECGNYAAVIVSASEQTGRYAGGIAGVNQAAIENCYNRGAIQAAQNAPDAAYAENGMLTVRENTPVGARILVTATADDDPTVSDTREVRVVKRDVQSVMLACESSFKITQSLALGAQVLPQNATYPAPSFRIVSATAQGAKIVNNALYASGVGTVTVEAVADGVASAPVVVRAEKEPVTDVRLSIPSEIFAGDYVPLKADVLPANATFRTVTYRLAENNAEAETDGNVLYARSAGTVRVCAYADGITQSVRITVHENAGGGAQTPALLWTGDTCVKVNAELRLAAAVYPAQAATGAVRYEIVRGENARLYGGNILCAASEGTVTVRAVAGELTCTAEITVEKEPVRDIVFAALPFKHSGGLPLTAQVLPQNATYPNITYEAEDDNGYIVNGTLYARRPGTVRLRATADGFTKVFALQAIKQAVTQIVFGDTGRIVLNESYRTGAIRPVVTVLPQNATYPDVTCEIVRATNCDARLENGTLRVTLRELQRTPLGYARDVQASVTLRAAADGVYTERTYTVYKSPVTGIVLGQSAQTAQNEWISQSERRFKTSGSMMLSVRILQEWATCRDYTVAISDCVPENASDDMQVRLDPATLKLTAAKPGKVTVAVTSLCGGYTAYFGFTVEEEPVHSLYFGIEIQSADNRIRSQVRGALPQSAVHSAELLSRYKDYARIEAQQLSEFSVRPFAYAQDTRLQPTYGDIACIDLYYEVNGVAKKFVSGESNDYFSFSGDILKVKEHAPVTRSFYLFAQSRYDGTVSARTEILVQSKYINEIRNANIDASGLITGLEGLYRRDTDQSDVTGISLYISHSSLGTVIQKTFATHDPTMRLQLYNPTIGGSFTVRYTISFRETYAGGYNDYSYTLDNVNYFGGINTAADSQTMETYYNSIQFFDFSGSDPNKSFALSQRVKYTYVYGGGNTCGAYFKGTVDVVNGADICLHSVTLISSGSVIRVQNYGALNIRIVGEVSLYGGKGANGQNGGDGIYSPATVSLSGDYLKVYGGNGGIGTDGADGVAGVNGGKNESGTSGTSGGNGMDGGNGGTAIRCAILNVRTKSLYAQGGNGSTGGNGGNGKNGGNGGDGQDGKPNGTYSKPGGNGGDGGNGGNGGNGGSGGHGICATINNYTGIFINAFGGSGASGGMGGKAGYGGAGGIGGNRYWSDTKKDDGVAGSDGSVGTTGRWGNNGVAFA